MITSKKVAKAEAVVKEASEEIRRRELIMKAKQSELAQAAADIQEAHKDKAEAEKLLAKANQEAEDARLKYFAHSPDAGPHDHLSKEMLARLGVTDLSTLPP